MAFPEEPWGGEASVQVRGEPQRKGAEHKGRKAQARLVRMPAAPAGEEPALEIDRLWCL